MTATEVNHDQTCLMQLLLREGKSQTSQDAATDSGSLLKPLPLRHAVLGGLLAELDDRVRSLHDARSQPALHWRVEEKCEQQLEVLSRLLPPQPSCTQHVTPQKL